MSQFLWLGNPENRRCQFFLQAAQQAGWPSPKILSYEQLLTEPIDWEGILHGVDWLRIESPGENGLVAKALLQWGAKHPKISAPITTNGVLARGSMAGLQQQYYGFLQALEVVEQAVQQFPNVQYVNSLDYIRVCFDKQLCHNHLQNKGIAVPPALYHIQSYEQLRQAMKDKGWTRVFIKPLHGSSASGVVAFRTQGGRLLATTSAEMQYKNGRLELFNSLRLSHYTQEKEIAALVNHLVLEGILVEQWIPKASLQEAFFDLRMVVIGGQAQHVVVRQSRSPLTNLHLGNERGSVEELKTLLGKERWTKVLNLAQEAATALPANHYASLDVLIRNDLEKAYILEANAFGDLLPRVLHQGRDTYAAVLHHLKQQNYV